MSSAKCTGNWRNGRTNSGSWGSKANEEAFAKVRADKEREASDGHDGTWVAHPGLVPVALEVFNREMPEANQIHSGKQQITSSNR